MFDLAHSSKILQKLVMYLFLNSVILFEVLFFFFHF